MSLKIPSRLSDAGAVKSALEKALASRPADDTATDPTKPIPHAYGLIPVDGSVDAYIVVHLEGVTAQKTTRLEPSGRPERARNAVARLVHEATERWRKHGWRA